MSAVVSALSACQKETGSGYLSAFPTEQFDRLEALIPVWAPYYTIHKILAGLLDQYTYADNAEALRMTTWMVEYFYNRVQNVIKKYSIERHWQTLNEEAGGMNDVLYKLFSITVAAQAKECTNAYPELASHTFRSNLLSSKNESYIKQIHSHNDHLTPSDDSAWLSLMPRKILREEEQDELFSWAMLYRKIKNPGQFKVPERSGEFLKEVSLHDVRLGSDSMHWRAQQTNLEYLLMLDVDKLVWNFRKTARLPAPGEPYGGWEEPSCELRGHFVGHYLSASALMWASTHNESLKEKMSAVVSALSACQKEIGSGYLSAFPTEQFDRLEALIPVWAPYYTIHKILAGLLDQYTYADNAEALRMTTWMVEYFYNRVQNVIKKYSIERHWQTLNEEAGGMNDVLYKLFCITQDPKHLMLAHLFDKPCFLGLLALQADDISGFHSNTHIPIVIGSQMRYEVTGDQLHKTISMFFMDIVNSSHTYATGGTSVGEFWTRATGKQCWVTNTEESWDNLYMVKVSRHLFRWTKEIAYCRSIMERSLTNVSKERSYHHWGTPFDSFCAVMAQGSGLTTSLNLRIPTWTSSNGAKATLNGQDLPLPSPGNFLSVTKTWSSDDKLTIQLPLTLRTEAIQDDRPEYASIQAILYGPYVLAGHSIGDWDITESATSLSDWITPIPASYNSQLITFTQEYGNTKFALLFFIWLPDWTEGTEQYLWSQKPTKAASSILRSTCNRVKARSWVAFQSQQRPDLTMQPAL
ncbi:hypothetical protein CUMW_150680 [Citrus unshiu]|uniref:Uncharacterized protein n=1 Tax=Citrus unshiu TaxID=55188 RepID=A0A2H5PMR7_CITUN|nr:hypothetical protein CUMW_150680 [Citrus unshiu]